MQTHGWQKEGDASVARVAAGELVQLELRVTASAWSILVDGQERAHGTCTSEFTGKRMALEELDLRLRTALSKVERWWMDDGWREPR